MNLDVAWEGSEKGLRRAFLNTVEWSICGDKNADAFKVSKQGSLVPHVLGVALWIAVLSEKPGFHHGA